MRSILIIDDEYGIVEILRDILRDEGYDVHIADGGQMGIDKLSLSPPDLVFVDLMMPIVSGKRVLAFMQSRPELIDVPVVVMSAVPETTAFESDDPLPNRTTYLRKPFRLSELMQKLEQSIGPSAKARS